ncbi:MAG TPA: hypothetical protein VHZ81_05270 [Galbitalea sp.]|jgi:hypothetical protein|nr:hypothetical protein [Galbitalea sp.]
MSLEPDPASHETTTATTVPLYRRPLVLIISGAILAVIIIGVFVVITLTSARPHAALADSGANPPATATTTPIATPTPTPTPTTSPAPSPSAIHHAAPPPSKPKPPASKPAPPAKTPPITPTISGFTAAKAQSCSNPGVTHISVVLNWTSTNGTRASLKSVSSYPAVSSKSSDTVTTAINAKGPLSLVVSCSYAKVVYTLTLEYEATGAPQTYKSASVELVTTS